MANVGAFFKKTLPSMALTVASEVPGPIGMVAGLVSNVLGKKVSADPASIDTAVQGATPDQLIALKEKDLDVQAAMQKAGFDDLEELARISQADVANARARQVALKDWTTPALAFLAVLSFTAIVILVLLGKSKVDAAFGGALVGYAAANSNQVYNYFFGSSSGSAAKTDILAKAGASK